ncbi:MULTISPECIES: type IVB secretion system protein IcmW [Pseudomonas]|uniref:Uncharacterized protein n=2 Tax=Pseudomonas TaxID=286 RepID=A0A2X2E9U8_PSELU|nr:MULTISPECIES: hypothetical protein [Pseudomonas]MCG7374316.1 hypothetical protein [Pseudomonas luteola]SER21465.1 hypothetical protein SAMN05216409_11436 [Pseudomonas lutea]SPZ04919.1 Uncharacterised protein [Pseudomonas luteola]
MSNKPGVDLTPSAVLAFWAEREPKLLPFFREMDEKEHWALQDIDDQFSALYVEVTELLDEHEQNTGLDEPLVKEGVQKLVRTAAALPCSASSRFFEWLGDRSFNLPYALLSHAHDHHKMDPDCSVIWQRARMTARYQILKEIVAEVTGGGDPL